MNITLTFLIGLLCFLLGIIAGDVFGSCDFCGGSYLAFRASNKATDDSIREFSNRLGWKYGTVMSEAFYLIKKINNCVQEKDGVVIFYDEDGVRKVKFNEHKVSLEELGD